MSDPAACPPAAAAASASPAAASAADVDKSKAGAMYHCDYCRRDISQLVRIKCAECADFDLCLECFQSGHHIAPHEPDHAYRVVHNVKAPLWSEDWGADEELLLLEALEMFGMGNWSDVADHVGSKTKSQCETHYDEVYTSTPQLLPDPNKALTRRSHHTKQEGDGEGGVKIEGGKDAKNAAAAAVGSSSSAVALPASSSSTAVKPLAKAHAVTKPKPKSGLGHLVGYTPNRGDFDTEYENDAELVLADMEFKEEDTKWERDLKLKVLEIYNSRLDARAERKKFILDRGLLDRKEKKRPKEEREIQNNMRVFAKFHSAEAHESFLAGLANEQRLRKRIEVLQNYRLNGIRSLADGELFEAEKRKREALLGKKGGPFDAPGSGVGGKMTGKKRSAAEVAEEDRSNKARKDMGGKGPSLTLSTAAAAGNSSAASSAAGSASALPDWDVSKFPGTDLLSSHEKQLCATLQMLPQHYLMIKERLIRECFTRGFLKENQAKQLIKIDVNKTSKIFDFFVSVGWLNTQDLIHTNAKQPGAGAPTNAGAAANGAAAAAASSSSSSSAAPSSAAKKGGAPSAPRSNAPTFAAPQTPAARFA